MEQDGNEKIELSHINKIGDEKIENRPKDALQQTNILESIIGKIGAWQIVLCIVLACAKIPVAWHHLGIIFLAPRVDSICEYTMDGGDCPGDCMKYKYFSPIFNNSIIMEWDLVCRREWLSDFTQTIFMLGTLLGNIIFGILSDRNGRRKPLLLAVAIQAGTGIIAAYSWDWYIFTFLRFILAISTGGTMLITLCITMEIVGIKYRQVFGVLFQIPFIIGHGTLALIAYYTRGSWANLQFWISIPTLVFLLYYWLIPESPRWLISKGRFNEAAKILEKHFKINGIKNLSEKLKESTIISNDKNDDSFFRIFKTTQLFKETIFLCICFLTCGICFYGVSQYVSHLAGDIFINVAISASIQIPGILSAIPLNHYLGRRKTLFGSFMLSAIFLLVIAALPISWENEKIYFAFIGLFGMSIAFPTAYIFAGEIFPTVLRNSGVGICTMISRIGAMIAPIIAGLNYHIYWLPPVIFGIMPLIGGLVTLLLPETHGKALPDTMLEFKKGHKKCENK